MKDIIVFIVDDILNIVYNNSVFKVKLSTVINQGYILDKYKFMEEFLKILKKEKIKSKLFGDNVTVVKNYYFNNADLFYLENIFLELGFLKVSFLDIRDLLPLDDVTFIEINNSYMVLYLARGIYFGLDYFKDIPKILNYFDDVKDNVILFGLNKNIPKIRVKSKTIYYFDNYETYVTDSLLKVKKYGA